MSFQTAIKDDEAWKVEIEESPGVLQIIDVHQTWAGPCKAIQSTFKRIFFDHGDKPMKFYTADASKVTAMNEHVGTCEPRFVFFRDGQQVASVKGVDAPALTAVIFEKMGIVE